MVHIRVRSLYENDLPALKEILRQRIRDAQTGEIIESDVENILRYMGGEPDEYGRLRTYLVAECIDGTKQRIIGCMAFTKPDPDMIQHFSTDAENAMELVSAFTTNVDPVRGAGRALHAAICEAVRAQGISILVENSGLRYEKTGWGFHDKTMDRRCGLIPDKYGSGWPAMTWSKNLNKPDSQDAQ